MKHTKHVRVGCAELRARALRVSDGLRQSSQLLRRFSLWLICLALLNAASLPAAVGTITETFDSGMGKFDAAVGNTEGGNNFGFSNTGNAGGTPGEIGGTFSQNALGYVANTALGDTLGWYDPLIIKAKVRTTGGGDDQVAVLGYFNATGTASDGERFNMLAGIGFNGNGPRIYLLLDGSIQNVMAVPNNTPFDVDLALVFNPDNNTATWSGTVAGQAVSATKVVANPARTINAFGLTSGYASGSPNNANSFFDNLQYSVVVAAGAPTFLSEPIVLSNAEQDQPYSGTIADVATDPDNDPLTFAKVSGPAWLTVAADGTLSGTPGANDTGNNSWIVSVTDGTDTTTGTLRIPVGAPPRFLADPIVGFSVKEGQDYMVVAATLAAKAVDALNEPLQFAKVSGPAWLQVGVDGALSGMPTTADAGPNTWTVSVTDGTYTSQATLQILVLSINSPLTVSTVEDWDGVQNPHAGEGITLSRNDSD